MSLLHTIITDYRNIPKNNNTFFPTIIKNPTIKLNNNEDTYFPTNIKKYIINKTKWMIRYTNTDHTICFYTYDSYVNLEEMDDYYKKIIYMLTILKKYITQQCSWLNIHIYLTPFKKELSNTKILDASNVNTGFSALCIYSRDIVIYRREEWLKVLTHECFHYYGLDFAYVPVDMYKHRLSKIFCISSEYFLYESYTECMSELIYLCMYSVDHNLNIYDIIRNELNHSLYQTNRILKHIGCTYTDLLCESHTSNKRMVEKTNVFCYYILKTLYFFYLPDFLNWCKQHNDTLLSFNKTESSVISLCDWIHQHYRSNQFISSISDISLKYKSEISNKSLIMNIYSNGL